jgi:hypothetical protein
VDRFNFSKLMVSEWIDSWASSTKDVALSTQSVREHLLSHFIVPAWGSRTLGSLTTEEITRLETDLPAKEAISRRTAQMARRLLATILGDAASARPPLTPHNRGSAPVTEAERAALLSGSDDDFAFLITLTCTGMRWAEAVGLEQDYLRLPLINVEWQLSRINGTFHRLPPKDDSYRSIG